MNERIFGAVTEMDAIMMLHTWAKGHYCFPNVHFGYGEMDMAILTRPAGYLWEIEVKLSLADWRADQKKKKWTKTDWFNTHISRMYYAVPTELIGKTPDFVPATAGILEFRLGRVWRVRPAVANKLAEPLSQIEKGWLFQSTHYRFWAERWRRHHMQESARVTRGLKL